MSAENTTHLTKAHLIPKHGDAVMCAGYTAKGPVRHSNEDAFSLPARHTHLTRMGQLLVVADGIGGVKGGATASRYAVNCLPALYYANLSVNNPLTRLRECIEMANALIRWRQRQYAMPGQMLTTVVAAVIRDDRVRVAFVGDSKAYLIKPDGSVQLLTEEHTQRHESAKAGCPTPEAWPPGVVTRALGLEDEVVVDIHRCDWMPGDRLVLCSDGLDAVPRSELAGICLNHPPQQAAERLVSYAHQIDGSDNATVIVAVNTGFA